MGTPSWIEESILSCYICITVFVRFLYMNTGTVHEKRNFGPKSDWELSSDRNDRPVNTVYRPLTRWYRKLKRLILLKRVLQSLPPKSAKPGHKFQNTSRASLFELQRPISNKSSVGSICSKVGKNVSFAHSKKLKIIIFEEHNLCIISISTFASAIDYIWSKFSIREIEWINKRNSISVFRVTTRKVKARSKLARPISRLVWYRFHSVWFHPFDSPIISSRWIAIWPVNQ